MNRELVPRPEFLPNLPKSDSIWGDYDILNSKESSQITLFRVKQLVDDTGVREGIYLGIRQVVSYEEYKLPLQVFDSNPDQLNLRFDDMVTAVSGPLTYSEAISSGYLLETAAIARDILDGQLKLVEKTPRLAFEEIVRRFGGQRRFVPLGFFTIHDYIARMAHYRNIKDDFPGLDMTEDSDEDLALVVGMGTIPLARALREDNYKIGDNFQQTIDRVYIGNQALFIPFAGVFGGHPKNLEDWQMVGLGLYTGVRLFRRIENEFTSSSSTAHANKKTG